MTQKRLASPSTETPPAKKARGANPDSPDMHDQEGALRLQIIHRNQQTSPLLRLPAELRGMIWAYALGGRTFVFPHGWSRALEHSIYYSSMTGWYGKPYNYLNLLFVCRQIHAETALLPYRLNMFNLTSAHYTDVKLFLERRKPAQVEAIEKMKAVRYSFVHDKWDVTESVEMDKGLFWAKYFNVRHWVVSFFLDVAEGCK